MNNVLKLGYGNQTKLAYFFYKAVVTSGPLEVRWISSMSSRFNSIRICSRPNLMRNPFREVGNLIAFYIKNTGPHAQLMVQRVKVGHIISWEYRPLKCKTSNLVDAVLKLSVKQVKQVVVLQNKIYQESFSDHLILQKKVHIQGHICHILEILGATQKSDHFDRDHTYYSKRFRINWYPRRFTDVSQWKFSEEK
jgi:hypothetical protein